jgi:hypothetical protein
MHRSGPPWRVALTEQLGGRFFKRSNGRAPTLLNWPLLTQARGFAP